MTSLRLTHDLSRALLYIIGLSKYSSNKKAPDFQGLFY